MSVVELLPLPEPNGSYTNPYDGDDLTNYTLAHVEPLLAEIEALRAEASTAHDAVLYHIAEHAKTRARAERLAEALRWAERHCPCGARPESPNTHPHVPGCPVGTALHPTAAQEEGNGQ